MSSQPSRVPRLRQNSRVFHDLEKFTAVWSCAPVAAASDSTPRVPSSRSFTACRRTRETAARQAAGCYGRAYGHSTNRTIVSKAAGWRDTRVALKAPRNSQSQTGSVTEFLYCNKEHSCPITYSFYRCGSCGHRITRASSTEPSSHSGHSLGHYTCPGRPMPQQSYPLYSNCRILARIGSLVNCNLTHYIQSKLPS